MNSKKDDLIVKKQFFIDTIARYCDKCGTPFVVEDVNILQRTEISSIIHFSCHNCKSEHIATFVSPLGMNHKVPINTDLSVKEINKFAQQRETSVQEILDLYMYLKKNSKILI